MIGSANEAASHQSLKEYSNNQKSSASIVLKKITQPRVDARETFSSEGETEQLSIQRANRYQDESSTDMIKTQNKGLGSHKSVRTISTRYLRKEGDGMNVSAEYDQNIVYKFYKSGQKKAALQEYIESQERSRALQTFIKKRSHSISNIF